LKKVSIYITLVAILIILISVFLWGFRTYPKVHPPPVASIDTFYVHDTVVHRIPYPVTIRDSIRYRDQAWIDSIVQANQVDTSALLADYYALHYYTRHWGDSLISVTLKDVVSGNRFIDSALTYQILRPQQVINSVINNYTYSRYLYAGADIPVDKIRNAEYGLFYASRRTFVGGAYSPLTGTFSFKCGLKLLEWH
jgi:hypothetical protein